MEKGSEVHDLGKGSSSSGKRVRLVFKSGGVVTGSTLVRVVETRRRSSSGVESEVMKIRRFLEEWKLGKSVDEVLVLDSLQRLRSMKLSIQMIKATDIAAAVKGLKHHDTKRIRYLAGFLFYSWKMLRHESDKVVCIPPATDDMRTETGGRCSDDQIKKATAAAAAVVEAESQQQDHHAPVAAAAPVMMRRPSQEALHLQKPPIAAAAMMRRPSLQKPPVAAAMMRQPSREALHQQKPLAAAAPPPPPPHKKLPSTAGVVQSNHNDRLLLAKRKLNQSYEEARQAKKQRCVKLLDIKDLPRQSLGLCQTKKTQKRLEVRRFARVH